MAYRSLGTLIGAILLLCVPKDARPSTVLRPFVHRGGMGVHETTEQIMDRDVEFRRRKAALPHVTRPLNRIRPRLRPARTGAPVAPAPEAAQLLPGPIPRNPQTLGTSFVGTDDVDNNPNFLIPLDAMGAVGPTQIVVISNVLIRVYDKSGNSQFLNADIDNFFSSVGGTTGTTDVRARYDVFSQRWFVAALNGAGENSLGNVESANNWMVAVSDNSSATSGWTFFSFVAGLDANFADSDTLGIDVNALYIGVAQFLQTTANGGSSFTSCSAFVVQKSSILGAGPLVVTAFPSICDDLFNGTFLPQGVDNDDPNASFGYLIGPDLSGIMNNQLKIIRISNPASTTPTIDTTFNVTVPIFGNTLGQDRVLNTFSLGATVFGAIGVPVRGCAPAGAKDTDPLPGVVVGLDDLDQRLTVAQMKNGHLFTVHNIDVDSSGNAIPLVTAGPDAGLPMSNLGRDGARWYDIINLATTPALNQSGTLFDNGTGAVTTGKNAGSTASSYFVPSIAASGQGHVAVGATRGGPAEFADVAVSGRLAGDPLGALQTATVAVTSSNAYNVDPMDPAQRWGDYSCTCIDAADNMTLWTFQEWSNPPTGGWPGSMAVQVIKLVAPPPATIGPVSPAIVPLGATSTLVTVGGTSVSQSGFYDGGALYPQRISALVGGGAAGVTVNQVHYISPTQVVLDLNTTGASAGTVSFTITNPDGQTTATPGSFTLAPAAAMPATVTTLMSSSANGVYGTGATLTLEVEFSQNVSVTGTPQLSLSSGGTADYAGGSGTSTLSFTYVVGSTDSTAGAPLDAASSSALTLNGGSIDTGATPATLTVPVGPTATPPLSLASTSNLVISTTAPVTTITAGPSNPSDVVAPSFTYSANQPNCTFQTQIDGTGWVSNGSANTIQLSTLALGPHTFQVKATDPLGNVETTPASYTWNLVTPAQLSPPSGGGGGGGGGGGCGALGLEALGFACLVRGARRARRSRTGRARR